MSAVTIDLTENPFERFLAALVDWVTPRDRPNEVDPVERAIRDFTAPLVAATDEKDFDRAFSASIEALPEILEALPRPTADEFESQSESAARKFPWLLQRLAGDVEPAALAGEFGALFQLHLLVLGRVVIEAPPQTLERAVAMKMDDLRAALRDPVVGLLYEALLVLVALVGIHEAFGRSDTWRRRRAIERGLVALRAFSNKIPVKRSHAWGRWLLRRVREVGLWPRDVFDISAAIEIALQNDPPNRTALLTLAERVSEGTSLIYVGDLQVTLDRIVGHDEFLATLDAYLGAGEAFERADISIDELARRWSLDVPEAIMLLENRMIVRSSDVLRLGEDDRRARLAKIDADRRARHGVPVHGPESVRRSVLASQRIEGIDARAHFPRSSRDPS